MDRASADPSADRLRFLETVESWDLPTTCPEHGMPIVQFESPLVTRGPATSTVEFACGCRKSETIWFRYAGK